MRRLEEVEDGGVLGAHRGGARGGQEAAVHPERAHGVVPHRRRVEGAVRPRVDLLREGGGAVALDRVAPGSPREAPHRREEGLVRVRGHVGPRPDGPAQHQRPLLPLRLRRELRVAAKLAEEGLRKAVEVAVVGVARFVLEREVVEREGLGEVRDRGVETRTAEGRAAGAADREPRAGIRRAELEVDVPAAAEAHDERRAADRQAVRVESEGGRGAADAPDEIVDAAAAAAEVEVYAHGWVVGWLGG